MSSGTHRKTPIAVGGASVVPVHVAAAEAEVPGRRRIPCLSIPHPPSGSFQQRRHVARPGTSLFKRFEFFPCGHAPAAAGNVQALKPCFGLIPGCISVRPGKPFQPRLLIVNHAAGIRQQSAIACDLFIPGAANTRRRGGPGYGKYLLFLGFYPQAFLFDLFAFRSLGFNLFKLLALLLKAFAFR